MVSPLPHDGRPNHLGVDLSAITHNVRVLRGLVGDHTKIVAALKANAYGFGVASVAGALSAAGVDMLAMVDAQQALNLRENGIDTPIILYGGNLIDEGLIRAAEANNLILTIGDELAAATVSRHATRRLPVFVEIDVGLERLGLPVEVAANHIRRFSAAPLLDLRGLYAHMHVPHTEDVGRYMRWQFDRFQALGEDLRGEGVSIPLLMAASSDVLSLTAEMNLDAVDVGKWLYGTMPRASDLGLRCAFASLSSRITMIKDIQRTKFLDLAPFPLRHGLRVGVAPIGIADGLAGLGCREALVRGRRVAILGSPSMEHCRLDLTDVDDAIVGDAVVFAGSQGTETITLAELPVSAGGAATWRAALEVRDSVKRVYIQ